VRQKRKAPSLTERLAAVLLTLKRGDGSPLIPKELHGLPAKEILKKSGLAWDHVVALALDGSNHPTNLQPLTIDDHKVKTKRDVKTIARAKRLTKDEEAFRRKMLVKTFGEEAIGDLKPLKVKSKKRWGSAPMPGSRNSPFKVRLTKEGRKIERRKGKADE
jgi:hypothetical protein